MFACGPREQRNVVNGTLRKMSRIAKRLIINTASNYLLRLVHILLNLIAIPIIVNSLGQEAFGLIVLANVIVGYFTVFDIGVPQGVTKYVSEYLAKRDKAKVSEVINTSIVLFFFIGLIVSLLVASFVLLGGLSVFNISRDNIQPARNVLFIAAALSVFFWPRHVLEGVFKGIQKYHKLNITLALGRILGVSLAIITSLLKQPIEVVFLAFNIDRALTGIWQYVWLRREIPFWNFRIKDAHISVLKMIFSFSIWLMLSHVAVMLEYQTDHIIIGVALPVAMITVYTVIVYPFRIIQQISGLACTAVMPAVSENQVIRGKQGVDVFIYKGVKYHNLVFAPFAIIGAFLCGPFIKLWMGPEYLRYVWIAQLSCAFQLIWQSNALLGQVYLGTGRSKKPGLIAIFIGVLNVLLSIWWVNIFGFPGVILATVVAGLLGIPLVFWLLLPDLQIQRWAYIKNVLLKAQLPLWIVGITFLPFWSQIQQIDTWLGLFTAGLIMAFILFCTGWIFVVDKDFKKYATLLLKNSLSFVGIGN